MPTKPLALTLGEPAGIGPDVTLKAWLRRRELKLPPFYLLGDRGFIADRAKLLGLDVRLTETSAEDASRVFPDALPIVATGHAATARPGEPDDNSAAGPLPSSPIRSQKACSTAPDFVIPAIPNSSPNSPRAAAATRRSR